VIDCVGVDARLCYELADRNETVDTHCEAPSERDASVVRFVAFNMTTVARSNIWRTVLVNPIASLCMADVTCDEQGRLPLPKELREQYGDQYYIVELPGGIKLVPVADDSLAALRDEFADVEQSAADLRTEARETAVDEAGQ